MFVLDDQDRDPEGGVGGNCVECAPPEAGARPALLIAGGIKVRRGVGVQEKSVLGQWREVT